MASRIGETFLEAPLCRRVLLRVVSWRKGLPQVKMAGKLVQMMGGASGWDLVRSMFAGKN